MLLRKLVFSASVAVCAVAVPYLLERYRAANPSPEGTKRAPFPFALRALVIFALVAILGLCAGASQIDDSYIYDRYIANALAGHGMVYNLGEHVNALSSPIFGYLLLFLAWLLRGNVLLASELLSALFLLLSALLAESLIPFAGLLLATSAYFYLLTGMETSVFIFMVLLETVLYMRGQYRWLPVVSVLLALTRFEGAILVAVVVLQIWRQKAIPAKRYFLPAALLILGYLLLNHSYYGVFLPSSAIAKLGQGFSGYWGKWPTAFLPSAIGWLHTLFEGVIYLVPLLIGLAISGLLAKSSSRLNAIAVPFCISLLLIYVGVNMPGDYFWYLAPLVLFALIYTASAIPSNRWGLALGSLLILLSGVQSALLLKHYRPKAYYYSYRTAGNWFDQHTPPDARIGAVEIGFLGWYSNRYLYDVIGLTTPRNAVYVAHHQTAAWLADNHPDYIFVHQKPWVWEVPADQSKDYVREPLALEGGDYILRRKDYTPAPR